MADNENWGESWLKSQQQVIDLWGDWLKQAGEASESADGSAIPDMGEGMTEWRDFMAKSLPTDMQNVFPKVVDAATNYLNMSDAMWSMVQNLGKSSGDWQSTVNTALDQFRDSMAGSFDSSGDAWGDFADAWGLDGEVWNKFASNNALGGFNPAMHPVSLMSGPGAEAYQRMFHTPMPALGANREWQEKLQTWLELANEYAAAAREYSSLLQEANADAVNILGDTLVGSGMDNAPDNLRAMYDLWVDSGEAAYSKLAMDERFVKVQGEQMNALLRLKQHEQCMGNDYLQMMNIPSRRELDSAHKRLQDTRREMRRVKAALTESERVIDKLRQELKAEFNRSKKSSEAEVVKVQEQAQEALSNLRAEAEAALMEFRAETKAQAEKIREMHTAEINQLKLEMKRLSDRLQSENASGAGATEPVKQVQSSTPTRKAPVKKAATRSRSTKSVAAKKAAPKKAASRKTSSTKAAPKKAAPKRATAKKKAAAPATPQLKADKGE